MVHTAPLSRRATIAGLGAGAALATVPRSPFGPGRAHAADGGIGTLMRERATRWLDSLNGEQREQASFTFDDATRKAWTYMLGARFAPGLALEQQTPEQKDLALDVFSAGLSQTGLETAMNIMLQQDILRDEWQKGSPDRNRERFSLMIFGTPSETGAWGFRWEGHHLTLSVTLKDDQVVSHTPKAFSSEPNTVPSGPFQGLVVLPENEPLGRAVFGELAGATRRQALLREASFGNIRATAGREDRYETREGVALGDLTPSQRDRVERLIAVYATDHLTGPLADAQKARLAQEDLAAVRFGWAGADLDGNSIYYRIHGQTFLIEFATLRNQPLHHHTIFHDLDRTLGQHVI